MIKMNIELTEEEREFLERYCFRALEFSKLGLINAMLPNKEEDLVKIQVLLEKLKK
jgi:hypothetical protein